MTAEEWCQKIVDVYIPYELLEKYDNLGVEHQIAMAFRENFPDLPGKPTEYLEWGKSYSIERYEYIIKARPTKKFKTDMVTYYPHKLI
jgi:hypothetical protein